MSQKDNSSAQITLGIVLPLCLLGIIIANLASGTVYHPKQPSGRGKIRFVWSSDTGTVAVWVLLKLAACVGMTSWYWLANRPNTERLAPFGLLLAAAIVIAATIVGIVDAVWY